LPQAFDGFRLLQISDLHADIWTTAREWDILAAKIEKEGADAIAITGDFVTRHAEEYLAKLPPFLQKLSAPEGVFAVLGNHDHYADPEKVRRTLADCGVRELRNEAHLLRRGESRLPLAGVDDVLYGKQRLDLVLDQLPPNLPAILLAHEPDYADLVAGKGKISLQLSGHSHGGQVRVPFFGPLPPMLPYMGRKYVEGRYRVGEMTLYVNRGIGMVNLPVRFCCRPEITVFTLRA
jgi:predicted MPP superfamily phosphohydrolase